jgi:hypothetical protein
MTSKKSDRAKREYLGWVIVSKRRTPVGVTFDDGSRTGFIEVFITRDVARRHLQDGEEILRAKVLM